MSKFVAKFRQEKDYSEEYATRKSAYDKKKKERRRDIERQERQFNTYGSDWPQEGRRYRK